MFAVLLVHRAGGVELLNRNEKIKVINTLDSRLDLIFQQVPVRVVA